MTLITCRILYKFLTYRMNAESNQGIQMIWVESELVLLLFFLKELSDAGKKMISN